MVGRLPLDNLHLGPQRKPLAIGDQIFENGKIRGFVNVFVGDEDIRFLEGDATAVKADDEVTLIPAIAGGF